MSYIVLFITVILAFKGFDEPCKELQKEADTSEETRTFTRNSTLYGGQASHHNILPAACISAVVFETQLMGEIFIHFLELIHTQRQKEFA